MSKLDPTKINFLIVDDIDNMRRSIRAMLKLIQYGRGFYEACNGKEAWRVLQEEEGNIHFVISDYNMPQMTGTELLNLSRSNRNTRDLPFLMITAEANMDIVAEAAEHDVDAYLTKPFVTATLQVKIDELIERLHNPPPMTLHLNLAREYKEKGQIDKALAEARKAIEAAGRSSRPFREMGLLFVKKGDFKNAEKCFKHAIQRNRLDVTSYHALGQIAYRKNDTEKAIACFAKAMEISSRHTDRALQFARILCQKQQLKEAEKVLRLAIRNKERDIDFLEEVAELALSGGIYGMAVKAMREVIKADPARSSYLNKKIGIALVNAGEHTEGTRLLETAAMKTPQDIELLLALARTYLKMNMPMRADNWAIKASRVDPDNMEARDIIRQCT